METKTTLTDETISTIQELIQVNIDSRDGFREAADNVEDATVINLFRELAAERSQQASELRSLVNANHEEPESNGSLAAAAHRTWMDLKTALGGGTASILNEAERGEDHIKGKYEAALKNSAGSAVSDVLNRHYADVKKTHDRVRDLRDAYKNRK
jgi:uncharacterized protein (TIGR02284 family)